MSSIADVTSSSHIKAMVKSAYAESLSSTPLPPCRVCGEKASGFHYGANTCEACKGFFRRSLVRNVKYRCTSKNDCDIVPGKRHVCAACRYMKCLAAGMSKNAIKTGRYTHEKKTRDIEEVKKLEKEALKREDGTMASLSEDRLRELNAMIDKVTTVHLENTPHSKEFFAALPEREAKFMESRKTRDKLFGPLKQISRSEYDTIYNTIGIDIDGRRALVAEMVPNIEKALKRFIVFAKSLPGFKDLPIDDQIALIKAGRCHTLLIQYSHLVNEELRIYYSPLRNTFVHLDDSQNMYGAPDKVRELLHMTLRCYQLRLTNEEQAIMAAMAVMSSPVPLSHVGFIIRDAIQEKLAACMLMLLEKSHDQPGVTFGNVMTIITQFDTIETTSVSKIEEGLVSNCPRAFQQYTIFKEITGIGVTKPELNDGADNTMTRGSGTNIIVKQEPMSLEEQLEELKRKQQQLEQQIAVLKQQEQHASMPPPQHANMPQRGQGAQQQQQQQQNYQHHTVAQQHRNVYPQQHQPHYNHLQPYHSSHQQQHATYQQHHHHQPYIPHNTTTTPQPETSDVITIPQSPFNHTAATSGGYTSSDPITIDITTDIDLTSIPEDYTTDITIPETPGGGYATDVTIPSGYTPGITMDALTQPSHGYTTDSCSPSSSTTHV